MLPNQRTPNKTETLFAPAEQYVYSHSIERHIRSSGAVCDFRHITSAGVRKCGISFSINIALRWRAVFSWCSTDMLNS